MARLKRVIVYAACIAALPLAQGCKSQGAPAADPAQTAVLKLERSDTRAEPQPSAVGARAAPDHAMSTGSAAGRTNSAAAQALPGFSLVDSSGAELSSAALVGERAFVVAFFASWCDACAQKLTVLRRAMDNVEGLQLLLVSVDGPDTQDHVPGFLREQRLSAHSFVDGLSYPAFVRAYNPVSSIPLVAVISQSGELVDYQVGLESGDGQRLEFSMRLALQERAVDVPASGAHAPALAGAAQ